MFLSHFPLSTLARLADGLGSKEDNPFQKKFTPKNWFPRFFHERIQRYYMEYLKTIKEKFKT